MELKLNLNLHTWIMECSIGDDISIRDRQTREILLVVCGGGVRNPRIAFDSIRIHESCYSFTISYIFMLP